MPTINEYSSKTGLYIRANHHGAMTTYQVSAEGERWIRQNIPGRYLDLGTLEALKRQGWAFTRGSGAGDVDYDEPDFAPLSTFHDHETRSPGSHGAKKSSPEHPVPAPLGRQALSSDDWNPVYPVDWNPACSQAASWEDAFEPRTRSLFDDFERSAWQVNPTQPPTRPLSAPALLPLKPYDTQEHYDLPRWMYAVIILAIIVILFAAFVIYQRN